MAGPGRPGAGTVRPGRASPSRTPGHAGHLPRQRGSAVPRCRPDRGLAGLAHPGAQCPGRPAGHALAVLPPRPLGAPLHPRPRARPGREAEAFRLLHGYQTIAAQVTSAGITDTVTGAVTPLTT